jgi:hypothetical protein
MVANEPAMMPVPISNKLHIEMFAAVQKNSSMLPSPLINLKRMIEQTLPLRAG